MPEPLALVIEDETDLADIFCEALSAAGYTIEKAMDGPAAMEAIGRLNPHLILLDLHLPGLDGGKVLKQIRSQPRLASARVLIASADAEFARHLECDADFVLLKPISFSQLRDLAKRLYPQE